MRSKEANQLAGRSLRCLSYMVLVCGYALTAQGDYLDKDLRLAVESL